MDQQRKQRLVGGLVLVCLAAIILPFLLDGEGYQEQRHTFTQIPPMPEAPPFIDYQPQVQPHADTTVVAELENANEPASSRSGNNEKVTDIGSTAQAQPQPIKRTGSLSLSQEKPQLDKTGVPVAWTLQLASFKERDNALKLRERLLKSGYSAYIRNKNDLSKVFVGPDIQRVVVEKLRRNLKQHYKLDGLILRFVPE